LAFLKNFLASITTLVAFWLFVRERHKREWQADLFLGFLHGIKALVKGMAQAGEEWRYKVDDKPEGYSRGYGNTCFGLVCSGYGN
jgi:hypothetical protein